MLHLVWHFLHVLVKIWLLIHSTVHTLQSYLISSGLLKDYKSLEINKLQYLAIVVDSEEAHDLARVVKLLRWLSTIGVKHICLYDMDGVLKKSKDLILEELGDARSWKLEADDNNLFLDKMQMTLEFTSYSDGKEGTAKAASFLCSAFLKVSDFRKDRQEQLFTESDMARALEAVGCGGPEPNLLLIYGPARCHLGFPPWRLRYTEIVHMGSLKSMKHGSIVKAIHKFTRVHQNYGT